MRSDDFTERAAIFLPEEARYDYLVDLPEKANVGKAINDAMTLIEGEVSLLKGALPKTYNRFEPDLLRTLLRIFNRDALKTASGDVFGRIYEYFLNKFAMAGGLEGGEVFTPPSLVRLIVNVIEPQRGIVFDPAAGSAGMFVQTGYFLRDQDTRPATAVTFFGQEKSDSTVNLARMNLAVHGLEGKVVQGNTYYEDIHRLLGRCDYVMANPPFNVDGINPEKVEKDPRLFTEKTIPGVSKKSGGVSNGNYLWIQYFYSYLNENGRAGFVMASSASDANYGEREIRREIIETGAVDVMIAIGTNFFYTRSLPCTLWFFDKAKAKVPANGDGAGPLANEDTVLMIDARNVYRVVTRKINDFSEEQLANLTAITWLYRGETERFLQLVGRYLAQTHEHAAELPQALAALDGPLATLGETLQTVSTAVQTDDTRPAAAIEAFKAQVSEWQTARDEWQSDRDDLLADLAAVGDAFTKQEPVSNAEQHATREALEPFVPRLKGLQRRTTKLVRDVNGVLKAAGDSLKAHQLDAWNGRDVRKAQRELEEARDGAVAALKQPVYFLHQVEWLHKRFPEGTYADVLGLCKVVTREEIYMADDSLTPGRYVGVAPIEFEDEIEFEERMRNIHIELRELNTQAANLANQIEINLGDLL